jgi:predicted nucleic acid-binding protein
LTFLIDTNVISELRKKTRCDANVAAWYATVDNSGLNLSVLVTGEIRKGIEQIKRRDPSQAAQLEAWLAEIEVLYKDRIIPIDREITDQWVGWAPCARCRLSMVCLRPPPKFMG